MPVFHSSPRGTSGHAASPSRSGLTACQMSTNGWSDDQHVRAQRGAGDLCGDPALLGARHQVVDQHADPARRARAEVAQVLGQVVDAAEVLDHDALDAQVVAPDLLHQLGVVAALDEDPAGPGHPGPGAVDGDRAGGGAGRRGRRRPACGGGQDDRPALEQEAGPEREGTPPAAAVLEGERVAGRGRPPRSRRTSR